MQRPPEEIEFPGTREEIIRHCEWVLHSIVESVNSRTFTSAPGWKYVSDKYTITQQADPRRRSNTKTQLLAAIEKLCAEYPDWKLSISLCTTEVDMEKGYAQVYANATDTGGPGVTAGSIARSHLTVFIFEMDEAGRWMAQRETTFFGLGGDNIEI